MKIAILSTYPNKQCGIGYFTKRLVDELRTFDNIKVIVIGDLESTQANYQVDFKSTFLYEVVEEIIKREQIELLHMMHEYYFYGKTNLSVALLHIMFDVPIITKVNSLQDTTMPILERIRANVIERVVGKSCRKVVLALGTDEKRLKTIPIEKVVQLPYGVSQNQRIAKVNGKRTILFFGLISEHKGVEQLIKSVRYLKNSRLVIVGRPNMNMSKINKLIEVYSKNYEIFCDFEWVSDEKMDKYFQEADVVALPYTKPNFGDSGVLYDALSYGLPCVVADDTRMGNVVKQHKLGIVVDSIDPSDIARGIAEVLNSYQVYQSSVLEFQGATTWKDVAKMYIELYQEVLNEQTL